MEEAEHGQSEVSEEHVFDDGSHLRESIRQSIQEFHNINNEMRSVRQTHQETKKQKLAERKAFKKNELLFTKKTEGLSKKAEFRSTIPSQ